ncbi:peroxisomal membrane protein 11A [Magnolia sinica]|uniref:peroxisomal membrane protein 11A n=1 Tax=Magnolia sinica TaxID=86752 RepID=UPI002659EBA1|nr:peroxisomal membrane protein 11A [Magnolia sinica]
MDSKPPPQNPSSTSAPPPQSNGRDFLAHLESYLAKRDGVDKLLKISRYASKIILSSSLLPQSHPLYPRLKSFESSVGLSRKAFRLGKFVQDVNALRSAHLDSRHRAILAVLTYGGEGFYYFVEQFVWLSKSGLIDSRHSPGLQKVSAWAELIGYVGSISLKVIDLRGILEEEDWLRSRIEELQVAGGGAEKEAEKLRRLREKGLLKKLSIVQDIADGLMAAADVRDGKGALSGPLLLASAGLLSAVISTHKNWISC